jgi:hypothetical protein
MSVLICFQAEKPIFFANSLMKLIFREIMQDHFITPGQLRAARAFLDWSRERCREESGVSTDAIKDLELERRKVSRLNIKRLVDTFATRGVIFVGLDGVILLSSKMDQHAPTADLSGNFIASDVQAAVAAIYASAPPLV